MASDGPERRRALPLTVITIGSVLAFLAIFAIWANRQLLDTDNWTDTSTQLLEDDEIRGQLSIYLIDQLYENVDVQAELADTLPPRLQPLAGPAAGAFQDLGVAAWIGCSSARARKSCGSRRIGVPTGDCSRLSRTVVETTCPPPAGTSHST